MFEILESEKYIVLTLSILTSKHFIEHEKIDMIPLFCAEILPKTETKTQIRQVFFSSAVHIDRFPVDEDMIIFIKADLRIQAIRHKGKIFAGDRFDVRLQSM